MCIRDSAEVAGLGAGAFVPEEKFLLQRAQEAELLPMRDLFEQIWSGSMPALNNASEQDWNNYYSSYVQTFLQRDVRALTQVNDELQFYRFLCAAASYTGSMINYAALALSLIHISSYIFLKATYDSGLICYSEYLVGLVIRISVVMMPTCIRKFLYNKILRKSGDNNYDT